jgi:hypothetical protein
MAKTKKHRMHSKKYGIKKRNITKKARKNDKNDKQVVTVWGKNKPLEEFWKKLASGKNVVVIYKNGKHKYIDLPKPNTQKSTQLFNDLDENKEVVAVLSSSSSTDTYELFLYPKAKDNSVKDIIQNYKKYFEFTGPYENADEGKPLMKKVMLPK